MGVAVVAVLATACVVPAHAAEPVPHSVASTSDATPYGACSAGWKYRSTGRGADTHFKVGATQSNFNGTSGTASSTFSAKVSGTASVTVSGGANVGVSAKLASVQATYGLAVKASMTASLGNSITVSIPSKRTVNADYGAWRAYTTGFEEYYTANCAVTQRKSVTMYSPYKIGWRTWTS